MPKATLRLFLQHFAEFFFFLQLRLGAFVKHRATAFEIALLPEQLRETAVKETVALLAPALHDHERRWTADYVRLRFIATV